jgi:isoleucyl-tRNA synthetase
MAPFTPFLAEELYRKLTGGESVHLLDWPETGSVDEASLTNMDRIREHINQGLSLRAKAGLKVRQPLASVTLLGSANLHPNLQEIIADELNVKQVILTPSIPLLEPDDSFLEGYHRHQGTARPAFDLRDLKTEIDTTISPELNREGLMREVIRQVQMARKAAGLEVNDRIALQLDTHDAELKVAIREHAETIQAETLAVELTTSGQAAAKGYTVEVKIEAGELAIALQKV